MFLPYYKLPAGRSLYCEFARARYLAYSLYHSIQDRDIRSVNFLLEEKNANPNHVLWEFGISPLHLAASLEDEKFSLEVLSSCLAHNGNPNVRSTDGSTPVHIAAAWKRMTVFTYLAKMGGDLNCIDEEGLTPFDYLGTGSGRTRKASFSRSIFTKDKSLTSEISGFDSALEEATSPDDECLTQTTSYYEFTNLNSESDVMNEAFIDEDALAVSSHSLNVDLISDVDTSTYFISISAHDSLGVAKRFSSPLVCPYQLSKIIGDVSSDAYVPSPDAYLNDNDGKSPGHCLVEFKSRILNSGSQCPRLSGFSSQSGTFHDANEDHFRRSDGSLSSCATDHLRFLLKQQNLQHGPIVKSTKRLYLYQLKKRLNGNLGAATCQPLEFNDVIIATLTGKLSEHIQKWSHLEVEMMNSFKDVEQLQTKLDSSKQYFTYLLLNPLINEEVEICDPEKDLSTSWKNFLKSVFYVGKGKNARPLAHLIDAVKNDKAIVSAKIKKIRSIWMKGVGIVCIHVFHNISEGEAFTREAAMITALGNVTLTNVQRGRFYGGIQKWPLKKKQRLGVVLLYRSMMVLMAEGGRQIFPSDLS